MKPDLLFLVSTIVACWLPAAFAIPVPKADTAVASALPLDVDPNALVPRVVIGKGTQLWPPPRKPSKQRPARPGSERQRKTSLKEKIKEIFKFGQKPPPDPGAEGATG
ncbi:hypothetical protein D9611_014188 [Ephemerocybe angulata]|uniref:Uncharacterized protein n=1 Tax=Ephemerocybe angulata TaxID=980116 RepID=A0A8H5FIJ0_9AGAR|nr:hypothetical protein D9611_014188 [Tulosesus angulatus]